MDVFFLNPSNWLRKSRRPIRSNPCPTSTSTSAPANTLVGYVTLEQVRKSQEGTLGFGAKEIERIEEDALAVEKCFAQFRAQQTTHGGKVTAKDKQELRRRLQKLDAQLDRYLAGEYGIAADTSKSKAAYEDGFAAWKESHEPFHWFVEFYGIMAKGGFDVIIGNPPYVNLRKVHYDVGPMGYATTTAGDLFALTIERAFQILGQPGRFGLIVPLSVTSTPTMRPAKMLLSAKTDLLWASYYSASDQPASLFTGVRHRLCVLVGRHGALPGCHLFTTRFLKWFADERPALFQSFIEYVAAPSDGAGSFPKVSSEAELVLVKKLLRFDTLGAAATKSGQRVYYHNAPVHWGKVFDFVPMFRVGSGKSTQSSHVKEILFRSRDEADFAICLLNSSLFYWFNWNFSNCRDLSSADVGRAPAGLGPCQNAELRVFVRLRKTLMEDYKAHKKIYRRISNGVPTEFDSFYPMFSKHVLDEIDSALAGHFNLTNEELDHITHYDLKYRFGKGMNEDEEEEEQ